MPGLWLNVITDLSITLAYYLIPAVLFYPPASGAILSLQLDLRRLRSIHPGLRRHSSGGRDHRLACRVSSGWRSLAGVDPRQFGNLDKTILANKVPARARFGDAVLQDFDKLAHACFAIHAFGR